MRPDAAQEKGFPSAGPGVRDGQARGPSRSPSSYPLAPSSGPREHSMPSPLGSGRPGPGMGSNDFYGGPPSITSRMGERGSLGSRPGPGNAFGGKMMNGSARGDFRGYVGGGSSQGYSQSGDFRGGNGSGSGGWDGNRGRDWNRDREAPLRERNLDWEHRRKWDRDRGPDRSRGPDRDSRFREWERERERPDGRGGDGGSGRTFSPSLAASDPFSSTQRQSKFPLEMQGERGPSPCASPAAPRGATVPKPVNEEERRRPAEGVAEEARAFAEREQLPMEGGDEVCYNLCGYV